MFEIAVHPDLEHRSDADRDARDSTKVGRDPMLLHARVDDDEGGAQRDDVGEMHLGHGDFVRLLANLNEVRQGVGSHADDAFDLADFAKQRVMEGHPAADHRWKAVVAHHRGKARPG